MFSTFLKCLKSFNSSSSYLSRSRRRRSRSSHPCSVLHIICIIISLSFFAPNRCPVVFVVIAPVTLFFGVLKPRWNSNWTRPGASILQPSLNARPVALPSVPFSLSLPLSLHVFASGKFIQFSILILLVFPRRVSRSALQHAQTLELLSQLGYALVIYCCIFEMGSFIIQYWDYMQYYHFGWA